LTVQVNNSFLFINGNSYTKKTHLISITLSTCFYGVFVQYKAKGKVLPAHVRKEYGGVKVYLHSFPGVKAAKTCADVGNMWSDTSNPLYVLAVGCLIRNKDTLISIFPW
jgi:hypothetical protein